MFEPCNRRLLAVALTAALLAGCGQDAAPPVGSDAAPVAETAAVAPPAPAITDEAGLRAAAAAALSEQRIYSPAGDNAIEHYLALRGLKPDDKALATALLEMLPYALIGSEQALARGDLAESRRLLDLVERADPQFPALTRLRDSIVAAEAEALRRTEAEAAALLAREAQAATDAEAAARAAAAPVATPPPVAAPPIAPPPAASTPPPAAVVAQPAVAAPVAAPPPLAAAPAPVATRPAASATPRLLSAPSPRYPIMAQRRKLEGDVTVEFTIQPDGSVSSPRVLSATTPGQFEDAALVAARRWRFEAGSAPVTTTRVVQL